MTGLRCLILSISIVFLALCVNEGFGRGRGSSRGGRRYRGGGEAGSDLTDKIVASVIGGLTLIGILVAFIVLCCKCPTRSNKTKDNVYNAHHRTSTVSRTQAVTDIQDFPPAYSRNDDTSIFNVQNEMRTSQNGCTPQIENMPKVHKSSLSRKSISKFHSSDIFFDPDREILHFR